MIRKKIFMIAMLMSNPLLSLAENLMNPERYTAFVSDDRAVTVGDAVTIYILENSEATSANGEGNEANVGIAGDLKKTKNEDSLELSAGINTDKNVSTTRAGKLRAQLTAEVIEIAANGKLHVNGSQKITVNGEAQTISIDGWIRPQDISAQNVVLSTRLQNAEIIYSGVKDPDHQHGFWSSLSSWLGF